MLHNLLIFNFNFVDFRHDLANQASLLALAAPKVQLSIINSYHPGFWVRLGFFFSSDCGMG